MVEYSYFNMYAMFSLFLKSVDVEFWVAYVLLAGNAMWDVLGLIYLRDVSDC